MPSSVRPSSGRDDRLHPLPGEPPLYPWSPPMPSLLAPRPKNPTTSTYNHDYHDGLQGYHLPPSLPVILRGDPPTLFPEPSVIALYLGSQRRFSQLAADRACRILQELASKQGHRPLTTYWNFTSPLGDRMLSHTGVTEGLILVPPDYTGS